MYTPGRYAGIRTLILDQEYLSGVSDEPSRVRRLVYLQITTTHKLDPKSW